VSNLATFLVAGVGGLVAGFVAYVLPDFVKLAQDDKYSPNWSRLIRRKLPVMVSLTILAALTAALALDPKTVAHAFYAGLGIQAALKGGTATLSEMTG
jgi:hypothetical protein